MTEIATAKALGAFDEAGRDVAEQLDLSGLGLRRLPQELFTAHDLKILDLSGNRLTELSDEISALNRLKRLDLGGNRLETLPSAIGRLEQLRHLDVSDNRLTSLPPELADCRLLESVELGNNLLTDVSALASHRHLTLIDLSRNRLTKLPALACADTLTTLDLANNSLEGIPDTLAAFNMLGHLDLSENCLTRVDALPRSGLLEIYLDGNFLTEPPLAVATQPTLRRFSASRNPFGALPEPVATPGAASQTTELTAAMREFTKSEQVPDHSNFSPPELLFAFSVVVNGVSAARLCIDLYFKRIKRYSVILKLADGTQMALHHLNRKAAMSLLYQHAEAARAGSARLTFASARLNRVADFTAELLARASSLDLVPDDPNRQIVHFHQHFGDQKVMGDNISFGNVSGSVINVKNEFSDVVQTLNASVADSGIKTQLVDLVARLSTALAHLPPELADDAEAIASTAQNLITEAVKEKPNRALVSSTIAAFRSLTEKLGKVAPVATEIVKLINTIVGG
jgi:hypothetical protein